MKTRIPSAPVIAVLLASLVAGCIADDGTPSSEGGTACEGEDTVEMHVLGHEQVVMLQDSPDPNACLQLCSDLGTYADECSWTLVPTGDETGDPTGGTVGITTSDGSSSGAADGTGAASTSGGDTGGASTSGSETSIGTGSGSDTGATSTSGGEQLTGQLTCTAYYWCVGGRGHASLEPVAEASSHDALARWLAAMAHSEAASVVAFRAIADELAAHGAPAELVRRAREAADDEVRHAAVMATMARGRGVEPTPPRFSTIEVRELEALALENAVEGCVRETWAALEACYQALRARDPALRVAMAGIAEDEGRHAQLSWDLDAWARTRLSPEAIARIDAARHAAVERLERTVALSRPTPLHAYAGIPEPATARALLSELRRALWRRAA